MTKRKNPEERSATAMPQPGQSPAKPTGGEVFRAAQKPPMTGGPAHLPATADEVPLREPEPAEVETLLTAASDYYGRLTEAAGRLSEHAADVYGNGRVMIRDNPASSFIGAFAVGVILGLLSRRR